MAEEITPTKKCRRDAMILLFTWTITSAFAEYQRELKRLGRLKSIFCSIAGSALFRDRFHAQSWLLTAVLFC